MPTLKTYDLFISHAWTYDEEYRRLVKMLRQASNFSWRNYSVPEHDRLDATSARQLVAELAEQIRPVNAVLVLSGMYANHRRWIEAEVQIAQRYGKPIIGVVPWGAERTPAYVQDVALTMVRWQTSSIVAAVRAHAI